MENRLWQKGCWKTERWRSCFQKAVSHFGSLEAALNASHACLAKTRTSLLMVGSLLTRTDRARGKERLCWTRVKPLFWSSATAKVPMVCG